MAVDAPDGPEATAAADPDALHGLYGPGSMAWRLNREAVLLLAAGPRALLLQLAHPLVAEGVDQHSNFRQDPWRRLQETLRSYLRIVYGSRVDGLDEIDRLNRLHGHVRGPVRDPVARRAVGAAAYRARDPELSLWVHATLVDSTIVGYEAWIAPLDEAERSAFYCETRAIGLGFGIPEAMLPADYAAFCEYLAAALAPDGPIQVTPTARSLAQTVLHPPLGPLVAPPARPASATARAVARGLDALPRTAYDWLMWPALELLPSRIRDGYGLPESAVRRLVSGWLVAGYRLWRPMLPRSLRWMPQARAADRRLAVSGALAARPPGRDGDG